MAPHVSSRSSVALLLLVVLAAACSSAGPMPTVDPNAPLVERYAVAGGGQIIVTVKPRYPIGGPVTIDVTLTAGTVAIRGPLAATVLSSGFEGEKVIRTIAPASLGGATLEPRASRSFTVTWDARTDAGATAPKDTYTLTLEFVAGEQPIRIGTTIEVVAS